MTPRINGTPATAAAGKRLATASGVKPARAAAKAASATTKVQTAKVKATPAKPVPSAKPARAAAKAASPAAKVQTAKVKAAPAKVKAAPVKAAGSVKAAGGAKTRVKTQTVISIDVGGTGMKCALVDSKHRVLHTERHATGRERGFEAVVGTIIDVANGLAKRADVSAIGVVVPGIVDETNGILRFSANLGARDFPLRDTVTQALGMPVAIGHDVRAGGLAEAKLGAGAGRSQVLFVPIGTGIAAAHVVNGIVATGAHGAAGEIGHIVVRPNGPQCGCGQRGCLESVASAASLQRRYTGLSGKTKTAAQVSATLKRDKKAAQVWDEVVDALSDGLLTGQALYDTELIIIGGGLAESGETLLGPLRESLAKKVTFHRVPEIMKAKLGDEAGCLGAALMALELI